MIFEFKNHRRDYEFKNSSVVIGGETYPCIVLYHKETGVPVYYPKLERWYLLLIEHEKNEYGTMRNRASAIVSFMNYILWLTPNNKLCEITIDDIRGFLEFYKETNNGEQRDVQGWERGIGYVYDFLMVYEKNNHGNFNFAYEPSDLYTVEEVKRPGKKAKRTVVRKINYLSVKRPNKRTKKNRLLVYEYLDMLIEGAWEYDPMITFGIMLQAFAGLREGEVVNVGRDRISLTYGGYGRISGVEINLNDLTEYAIEYNRTHKTKFGEIKIPRSQKVYYDFIDRVVKQYDNHLMLLDSIGADDSPTAPLFFNEYGNPMTVKTYCNKVRDVFYNVFLPNLRLLCKENDSWAIHAPFVESYEKSYPGAHMFRHWFTMYLLERTDMSRDEIAHWRGDSSPDSMNDYVHENSNMILLYNNAAFNFQQSVLKEIL